jgi:hypothetical protein
MKQVMILAQVMSTVKWYDFLLLVEQDNCIYTRSQQN